VRSPILPLKMYWMGCTDAKPKIALLIVVVLTTRAFSQGPPPAPTVFTNSALGFRYIPPTNMRDLTGIEKQWLQQRAAALGKTNTLTILLALRSGPDDTATDWHSVAIETYSRQKLAGASDRKAMQTMSRWVSGLGSVTAEPTDTQIGSFHFVVLSFDLREGQRTKYARVYTTILKDQILSLAFSANSSEVLNRIVASMKTFEPVARK